MQPRTKVKFDRASFDRIARTIRNTAHTYRRRKNDSAYAASIPEEIGIQLTNRCNLRCKHCFQWNEDGFFHRFEKPVQEDDISIQLVEKIFKETRVSKANLYLWGGEPLVYRHWDALAGLLTEDPRWTVLCTNGLLIEEKLQSILKISGSLAILLSLDGFSEENDAVRGKGTFDRVVHNIRLLMNLKKQGIYKGEVSVNCVISDRMAPRLYEYMEYFEQIGVNTVYFCFPWYLPQITSENMDRYFTEHFSWLCSLPDGAIASWHSYKYRLDLANLPVLLHELNRIYQRVWNIRIRLQPALEPHEIKDFILGNESTAQKRHICLALSTRMNVLPSGKVTLCKLFPEFTTGDLNREGLLELWHNQYMKKCREIIWRGLMPVCSKCILLYLHGR